jgi:hypothetical protein
MGRESFEKREREKKRLLRSAEKRERREHRSEHQSDPAPVDMAELMERFRVLSEQHASGAVSHERYDAERRRIFTALGFDAPSDG